MQRQLTKICAETKYTSDEQCSRNPSYILHGELKLLLRDKHIVLGPLVADSGIKEASTTSAVTKDDTLVY